MLLGGGEMLFCGMPAKKKIGPHCFRSCNVLLPIHVPALKKIAFLPG